MSWAVRWTPAAQAALGTLDFPLQERVIDLFDRLADDADGDPPPDRVHCHVSKRVDGRHMVFLAVASHPSARLLEMVALVHVPPAGRASASP